MLLDLDGEEALVWVEAIIVVVLAGERVGLDVGELDATVLVVNEGAVGELDDVVDADNSRYTVYAIQYPRHALLMADGRPFGNV